MVRCVEIIILYEKIGKGILDNWDKFNNKRIDNVLLFFMQNNGIKKIIYKEIVKVMIV